MQLSLSELRKITHGVVDITEENGIFTFRRLTRKGLDHYASTGVNPVSIKADATTGVRFDFYTDSALFAFTYRIKSTSSCDFYHFDILVDGIFLDHRGEDSSMWIKTGRIEVKLPAGEHRVTVWFPSIACAFAEDITLDDGASFRPVTYQKKLLCFGDSITQGHTGRYPSLSYPNQLAVHFDAEMINQGVGGERYVPEILDEEFAKAYVPDIITVAYGTNDWSGLEWEVLTARCEAFLKGLSELYPDSRVFVQTPLWRADYKKVTKSGPFENAVAFYRETAEKYGLTVIDGNPLTPHFPGFYADSRLHPNDLGFAIYAQNLIAAIEKELAK